MGNFSRVKQWFDESGAPALGDLYHHYPCYDAHTRGHLDWDRRRQHVLNVALAWSVVARHFEVADFLLEHGADQHQASAGRTFVMSWRNDSQRGRYRSTNESLHGHTARPPGMNRRRSPERSVCHHRSSFERQSPTPPERLRVWNDVTDAFLSSGELTVTIDASDSGRLLIQPAFPGTLTFKANPGQAAAANPAAESSAPITGTPLLKSTEPKAFRRLQRIAHFGYPVLLADQNVTLTPAFFATVVADARILESRGTLGRNPSKLQKTHAFAKGDAGISISPTRTQVAGTWPLVTVGSSGLNAAL